MKSLKVGLTRRGSMAGLLAGAGYAAAGGSAAGAVKLYRPAPDIVVAKDGSGQFDTVQAAVQSIPKDNMQRTVVLVRNGLYNEKVRVDAPYVTLRGESRHGVRIAFDAPSSAPKDEIGTAVLNISSSAHDFVAENLTIHNTHRVTGPHAFAVMGRADRSVVQDADIYSLGADTLSMWRTTRTKEEAGRSEGPGATPLTEEGGRYYHARLRVAGSVDFICPRGWCHMIDSVVLAVNHFAEAAIWHSATHPDHKFVMRRTHFDGPPGFYLGRKHRDAAFYLIDCSFSERLRDQPIYRVIYPLDGSKPTEADIKRNADLDKENVLGDRTYYHNAEKADGEYPWMAGNLAAAKGGPKPSDITAAWTFGGTWNPERGAPSAQAVNVGTEAIEVTFTELVTVKGAPQVALRGGGRAAYVSGSGTNRLRFAPAKSAPSSLDFTDGVVIASEAASTLLLADPRLPRV
jgi:pectinesterase